MKYIFVAGAPGSKWSSVVKNIYYSPSIDRSDYRDEWTYYHDASGERQLMHLGAYFDPGMICALPRDLTTLTKQQLENIFDAPFSADSTGTKIIKSHVFSNHIDFLRRTWPEIPIVMVRRGDDACLGWWVKCGHFDISYPDYHEYFKDFRNMARIIHEQNSAITTAWQQYSGTEVLNNHELCSALKISVPSAEYQQNYSESDIEVKVI